MHQKRRTNKYPGQWHQRGKTLMYYPMFPKITDNDTDRTEASCKYAGYLITDTRDRRHIDAGAPDRWQAVPLPCLGDQPEHRAATMSLLLEELDRMYMAGAPRDRRYVPGTRLRHETEAA